MGPSTGGVAAASDEVRAALKACREVVDSAAMEARLSLQLAKEAADAEVSAALADEEVATER